MFLEPPAQAAVEVQLPVLWLPFVRGVLAGQRVIARPVKPGVVHRDRVRMDAKVTGVKVDDIGQHRFAAFLGVEGQKLTHAARLAEGEEQVFGVVAVVNPGAGKDAYGAVHGIYQ